MADVLAWPGLYRGCRARGARRWIAGAPAPTASLAGAVVADSSAAGAPPAGGVRLATRSSTPVATSSAPIPAVGALFVPSVLGSSVALGLPHECSGVVVDSPARNLVLTAAHCLAGTGIGYDFAPGYHDGVAPYGVWAVQRIYVDPAWSLRHDPHADYAFLQVEPNSAHTCRSRTAPAATASGRRPRSARRSRSTAT